MSSPKDKHGIPLPSNVAGIPIDPSLELPDEFKLRTKDRNAANEIIAYVESLTIKDMLNAYQRGDVDTFLKIAFYFMEKEIRGRKK